MLHSHGFFIAERAVGDYPRSVDLAFTLAASADDQAGGPNSGTKAITPGVSAAFNGSALRSFSEALALIVEADHAGTAALLADGVLGLTAAARQTAASGSGGGSAFNLAASAAFQALTAQSGGVGLAFSALAGVSALSIATASETFEAITAAEADAEALETANSAVAITAAAKFESLAGRLVDELATLGVVADFEKGGQLSAASQLAIAAAADLAAIGLASAGTELILQTSASLDNEAAIIGNAAVYLAAEVRQDGLAGRAVAVGLALDALAELATLSGVSQNRAEGVCEQGGLFLATVGQSTLKRGFVRSADINVQAVNLLALIDRAKASTMAKPDTRTLSKADIVSATVGGGGNAEIQAGQAEATKTTDTVSASQSGSTTGHVKTTGGSVVSQFLRCR